MAVAHINGTEFELKPTFPRYAAISLTAAQRSKDQVRMTEAMLRLIRALVVDWEAFDAYMLDHDEAFDHLDDFLSEAIDALGLGPTNESSDSLDSSSTTPTTSRAVSLSRGTVEVVDSTTEESSPEPDEDLIGTTPPRATSGRRRSRS